MSFRLKLVGSFVLLSILGLAFGSYSFYEGYSNVQRKESQDNLYKLIVELGDIDPQKLSNAGYLTYSMTTLGSFMARGENAEAVDINAYFHQGSQPKEPSIQINQRSYLWALVKTNEETKLYLKPYQPVSFLEFVSLYFNYLIILYALTLWLVIWVALIIFSLFQKIDQQNQILEQQTNELEQRHKEAIEASETKSKFLANVSHEIRTPLSAILSYSETLLHSDQPMRERLESINTIIRNSQHLLTLVNDLLDLSKIEAGKLVIEKIPLNILSIAQDIERLFKQQAKTKGLEFTVRYHFPLPKTILSDPVRLKQIIINLCSNAIKFTKSGYVYIDISQTDDNTMCIQVEDSGIGMSKEEIDRIFIDYQQANTSTTRRFGGTGLGLSLSKYLAGMLGGDITVSSHPGRGSIFSLCIDTGDSSETPVFNDLENIVEHEQPIALKRLGRKLRGHILLAEDNPDNQILFSMYFKKFGVDMDVAHNGQQAIEYALSNSYDLIFMDMQMPIMDGIEATYSLRKKGINTPIVALTAATSKEDIACFTAAGCNEYVNKPVTRETLYSTMANYLPEDSKEETQVEPIISELYHDADLRYAVVMFVQRLPQIISSLQAFISNGDYENLSKIVHDLKGTSGNVGFQKLAEISGKLEFQIANQNSSEIAYLFDQLCDVQQRIISGIDKDELKQ